MKIVVVGAGAMGSIYAGMFHESGHQVSFVEANPAAVETINKLGAVIVGPDGKETTYRLSAVQNPSKSDGVADIVLFQIKGFATAAAAETVRPVVGDKTILLTLQNGLGNEDVLRAAYPANPLVIGVSLHSAAMTGPGRYHHTGVRATSIGPSGPASLPAVATVADALAGSRYEVHVLSEAEIRSEIFSKWVLNCGSLPTAALTGLATTAMSKNETVLSIIDALTREACVAARAEGAQLDEEERIAFNRELFRTAGGKASMLQDIEARRRTEIDTINGAAVRLADKHGLALPLNRAVVALVKGREDAMGLS